MAIGLFAAVFISEPLPQGRRLNSRWHHGGTAKQARRAAARDGLCVRSRRIAKPLTLPNAAMR